MSSDEMADFYVHTATVETFTGTSGYGVDQFNTPVTLDPTTGNGCFIDGSRKLVRANTGEQVVSETTLYTFPANVSLFTPDTKVTTNGVTSRVIKVTVNDSGPLDLPDHIAVSLT